MIAVKDLQIGDYINTETNGVVQVTVLSWRGVGYAGGASTQEHCNYIPLTEDILEKNSIKISSFTGTLYWFDEDEQCCVKPIENRFMFMYSKGADYLTFRITYVHQLQHLLRLCNVQKEIEL